MLVLLLCWIFLQCVPGRSSNCSPGFDGMNCARENIAFGRRTSQSSDYKDITRDVFYKSDLAVDGNINTDFNNGSCTNTDQRNDQSSWEVLLDHEIKSKDVQMVIYLRSVQGVRYKNFRIFIGNALCKRITDLATTAITPPTRNPLYIADCTTPLSGSSVTIKAATGDLTLCEVQIWQCKDGYFGSCLKKCNCYNTSEVCDKTTGACPMSGCSKGTHGVDCQMVCPERRYGRNCSGACGRCRNSEPCNKKSGECSGGCEPGYRTSLCDTEVPDDADACEPTTIDVGTVAFSTTVCVLAVIIVILTISIIRMKLKRGSSDNRSPGIVRPIPDAHRPIPDPNISSTPATYEPFQLTEDNQYTSLERPNLYVNTQYVHVSAK